MQDKGRLDVKLQKFQLAKGSDLVPHTLRKLETAFVKADRMLRGDAAPRQVGVEPAQVAVTRGFALRERNNDMPTQGKALVCPAPFAR